MSNLVLCMLRSFIRCPRPLLYHFQPVSTPNRYFTMSAVAAEAALHKDEVTGEMVSKRCASVLISSIRHLCLLVYNFSELKKRVKQRERDAKKAEKVSPVVSCMMCWRLTGMTGCGYSCSSSQVQGGGSSFQGGRINTKCESFMMLHPLEYGRQ